MAWDIQALRAYLSRAIATANASGECDGKPDIFSLAPGSIDDVPGVDSGSSRNGVERTSSASARVSSPTNRAYSELEKFA